MINVILPVVAVIIVSIIPVGILVCLPSVISSPKRRGNLDTKVVSSVTALNVMLCFAAGSLVSDALLHLIADSVFGDYPSVENTRRQMMATVMGVLLFFTIDILVRSLEGHPEPGELLEENTPSAQGSLLLEPTIPTSSPRRRKVNNVSPGLKTLSTGRPSVSPEREYGCEHGGARNGILSLVADAIHNFTDGLALAAAFARDLRVGMTTTLAIFFHEVPHELGDYAILAKSGFKHQNIIWLQLLTASASFLGVFVGLAVQYRLIPMLSFIKQDNLLPFAAGGFLYVALCTILPEVINDDKSRSWSSSLAQVAAFIAGILMMAMLE